MRVEPWHVSRSSSQPSHRDATRWRWRKLSPYVPIHQHCPRRKTQGMSSAAKTDSEAMLWSCAAGGACPAGNPERHPLLLFVNAAWPESESSSSSTSTAPPASNAAAAAAAAAQKAAQTRMLLQQQQHTQQEQLEQQAQAAASVTRHMRSSRGVRRNLCSASWHAVWAFWTAPRTAPCVRADTRTRSMLWCGDGGYSTCCVALSCASRL